METRRIRLGTEEIRKSQIESEIANAVISINTKLREAIESIGFETSEAVILDCLDGGKEVTQKYYERQRDELKFVSSPSSKALFENAGKEGLDQFHKIRQAVVENCSSVRNYITFDTESWAIFSPESMDKLNEDTGKYITDPEYLELYDRQQEACDALNRLYQGSSVTPAWYQIFEFDRAELKFKPHSDTNYNFLLMNIKIAKQNGSN